MNQAKPKSEAIDWDILEDLMAFDDDPESSAFIQVIDLFLEMAPKRIQAMEDALLSNNNHNLKREDHALKGGAGTLGALKVQSICIEMENFAAKEQAKEAHSTLLMLKEELSLVEISFGLISFPKTIFFFTFLTAPRGLNFMT